MNTTTLISPPQPSEHPTFGDEVTEFLPWVAAIVVLGPITLLSLMLWAPFLLVLALIAAPTVAVGLLGVGAAILATPYLLIRHGYEYAAERHRSRKRSPAIPARSPLSGLVERTTVGGAQ
jgi:hypothetical protein